METEGFAFSTSRTNGAVTVSLEGELDLASAPRLSEALVHIIDGGGKNVVLDLSQLAFIDSTGLSIIVTALKRLRESGGELALQGPTRGTMKVLEISGVDRVLEIRP